MSWAVGGPDVHGRWIGYGVPATCDYPGCGKNINRGLAFACGGGVMEDVPNCGQFFCTSHLGYFKEDDRDRGGFVCERCASGGEPFDPTPDTSEWLTHLLTDESWQVWRDENSQQVEQISASLRAASS
jgi:hypothetical protein